MGFFFFINCITRGKNKQKTHGRDKERMVLASLRDSAKLTKLLAAASPGVDVRERGATGR